MLQRELSKSTGINIKSIKSFIAWNIRSLGLPPIAIFEQHKSGCLVIFTSIFSLPAQLKRCSKITTNNKSRDCMRHAKFQTNSQHAGGGRHSLGSCSSPKGGNKILYWSPTRVPSRSSCWIHWARKMGKCGTHGASFCSHEDHSGTKGSAALDEFFYHSFTVCGSAELNCLQSFEMALFDSTVCNCILEIFGWLFWICNTLRK